MIYAIRLIFYSVRLLLFMVCRILGSRLILVALAVALYVAVVKGLDGEAAFWTFLAAAFVRVAFSRAAKRLRPGHAPVRRHRQKPPKTLSPAMVTRLAVPVDSPDEATITGRLSPIYQRLLDPPGRPLETNIYPNSASAAATMSTTIDGETRPASDPALRPRSP